MKKLWCSFKFEDDVPCTLVVGHPGRCQRGDEVRSGLGRQDLENLLDAKDSRYIELRSEFSRWVDRMKLLEKRQVFAADVLLGKKIIALIAVLTGLSACNIPRPTLLPNEERRAIDVFKEAWSTQGLPSLEPCYVDATRIVHTKSVQEFRTHCGTVTAAECTEQENIGRFGVPKIILRPDQAALDSEGGPIVHGLIHWSTACTRLLNGSPDPGHRDPRLWKATGGDTSVQGRARKLLGF